MHQFRVEMTDGFASSTSGWRTGAAGALELGAGEVGGEGL